MDFLRFCQVAAPAVTVCRLPSTPHRQPAAPPQWSDGKTQAVEGNVISARLSFDQSSHWSNDWMTNDVPLQQVVCAVLLLPAALSADQPLRSDHPQTGSGQVLTSLFQPIIKKLPHKYVKGANNVDNIHESDRSYLVIRDLLHRLFLRAHILWGHRPLGLSIRHYATDEATVVATTEAQGSQSHFLICRLIIHQWINSSSKWQLN